jgi:hypothetical protein
LKMFRRMKKRRQRQAGLEVRNFWPGLHTRQVDY